MFIEGVVRSDRESIAHPVMQAPIVENLIRDITGELSFPDHKRMLDLAANAITPGIDLRLAPAPLEPVAFDQRELSSRKAQGRAQSNPIFIFTPAMRWFGLAMKIKWIET